MTRERISITALLMRQKAWLALFPIAVTVVAGGISAVTFLEMRAFEAQAVETTGQIRDRSESVSTRTSSSGTTSRQRSYSVTYSFETRDGTEVDGAHDVSARFYNRVERGDSVRVQYLPGDPQVSRVQNRAITMALVWGGLALIPAAISVWAVRRFGRRIAAMLRAGRRGEQRSARVIDHVPSKAKMGDAPMSWRLRWRDETGAEGESLGRDGFELDRLAHPGREIAVHVDPVSGQAFWARDIFGR